MIARGARARSWAVALALATAAAAGDARADEPVTAPGATPPTPTTKPTAAATADDPPAPRPDRRAVAQAREANFEPLAVRDGFAIGAALGPSMQLGFGISESSGTGGGFGVRVGTVASPRWVWLLELAATVYRQEDDTGKVRLNQSALLTVGGQLYLRPAIWIRGGVGFASFTRRTENLAADQTFNGLGTTAAVGFDLYQDGGLAWSLELLTLGARYRSGTVLGGSMQVGFSWY